MFSGFAATAFSYPISPRPLRKLIIESQYIVWGKVIKTGTENPGKESYSWDTNYALIDITEQLQGTLKRDTIKVYFSQGMICPAPGVFYDDEMVLAFLDGRNKKAGYEVHALSYGVKHDLSDIDYLHYKQRIAEMQELIRKKAASDCSPAIIDWLMKCAASPATRWDGLYEITPESDFMSFYEQGQLVCKDSYITTTQRKQLFDILLAVDTMDYNDMALIDLTAGINDSLRLGFLKQQLIIANDTNGYFWMAKQIMPYIAALSGDKELGDLSKEFDKGYFDMDEKSKENARRIYRQFLQRMQSCELKKTVSASGHNNT